MMDLDFQQAIWLLPVAVLIHVLEELPRFPGWAKQTLKTPYTTSKFVWENVVLFVILVTSVTLAASFPPTTHAGMAGVTLVLSAAVGLFSNVLFHGLFTLRTGVYSPGTVTACLFFAPLSILIYYLAAIEGLLTLPVVGLSIVLGISLLPIVVAVVHGLIDGKVSARSLVKFALMVTLPPILIGVASILFNADVVHKVLIYAGPLALLPLVLKWARRRTGETNTTRGGNR